MLALCWRIASTRKAETTTRSVWGPELSVELDVLAGEGAAGLLTTTGGEAKLVRLTAGGGGVDI